jgi:hypothetical protein
MKKRLILTLLLISFFNLVSCEEVILKLEPEKVETEGDLVKINITIDNIPPEDSLNKDDKPDGGLGGLDIYINYSPEYLEAVRFDWSDVCEEEDVKSYEFKDGEFFLTIMFNEGITDEKLVVGTLVFNPKKTGEIEVTFENKSVISSIQGKRYDGFESYPKTTFKGCKVTIKGVGESNVTKNLKEEYDEAEKASKIINKITVVTNQTPPKVIVKEINVSEIEPNVSINLKVDYEGIDVKLLCVMFIVSLVGGIVFGYLVK